jgi:hypothetical protein
MTKSFTYFTMYIPEEFSETWQKFVDLCATEEEKKYKDSMKKIEKENSTKKGITNKNYRHTKNSFISMAIRRAITTVVRFKETALMSTHAKEVSINQEYIK